MGLENSQTINDACACFFMHLSELEMKILLVKWINIYGKWMRCRIDKLCIKYLFTAVDQLVFDVLDACLSYLNNK